MRRNCFNVLTFTSIITRTRRRITRVIQYITFGGVKCCNAIYNISERTVEVRRCAVKIVQRIYVLDAKLSLWAMRLSPSFLSSLYIQPVCIPLIFSLRRVCPSKNDQICEHLGMYLLFKRGTRKSQSTHNASALINFFFYTQS